MAEVCAWLRKTSDSRSQLKGLHFIVQKFKLRLFSITMLTSYLLQEGSGRILIVLFCLADKQD